MSSQRQLLASGHARRVNMARIRIDMIHVEPGFNLPESPESFRTRVGKMVEHLRQGGRLPAIEVRERAAGGVWLVDGHARHEAYAQAHAEGVEVADEDGHVYIPTQNFEGNDFDRLVRLKTSADGRVIEPHQLADLYKRMRGLGKSVAEIARRVQMSVQHVTDMLTFGDADSSIQDAVVAGKISATEAVRLVRREGDDANRVLQESLKVARAAGKTKVTNAVLTAEKRAERARQQADLLADAELFRWLVEHGAIGIGYMGHVEVSFEKPLDIKGHEDLRVIVKAAKAEKDGGETQ